MADTGSSPTPTTNNKRTLPIILGIVLLCPAMLACAASQLALSIGTLVTSLQKSNLLSAPTFVGLDNYTHLFQDKLASSAFGFSGQTALLRVLLVAILPPLLAWGVSRLNRPLRLGLRVIFSIPPAMCAPLMIAFLWFILLAPGSLLGDQHLLERPASAQQTLQFIDGLYTLGLGCALGLIFYLAAFRGLEPGQNPRKPLLAAWGISLLVALASGLQSFSLSYVLTAGGPANATASIVFYIFKVAFQYMQLGVGAAGATVLLIILGICGLAAGLIAILSGLRLELPSAAAAKAPENATARPSTMMVALIVGLLAGLAAICLGLAPLLGTIAAALKGPGIAKLLEVIPPGTTLLNTFLPPIVSVLLIQVPLTWLAAFGIGALRPLGKHSEWLLLPFCPWLFTGLAPFSLSAYQAEHSAGLLNTLIALIPPIGVSIPMLVILTLFFKGQARTFESSGVKATFTHFILPSLPLLAMLAGAGVFIGTQDLFWGLVFANKAALYPLSVALLQLRGGFGTATPVIANALLWMELPILVFAFVALAVFQVLYLDRLSLSTETKSEVQ